jgi:hypothetical protein
MLFRRNSVCKGLIWIYTVLTEIYGLLMCQNWARRQYWVVRSLIYKAAYMNFVLCVAPYGSYVRKPVINREQKSYLQTVFPWRLPGIWRKYITIFVNISELKVFGLKQMISLIQLCQLKKDYAVQFSSSHWEFTFDYSHNLKKVQNNDIGNYSMKSVIRV